MVLVVHIVVLFLVANIGESAANYYSVVGLLCIENIHAPCTLLWYIIGSP